MRHIRLVLILGLALLACACSTSNQGVGGLPDWSGERQFTAVTEQGLGTFTPQLTVNEDATGATVVVTATQASDLEAAYVHLNYDPARYTPARVEFGSFLGDTSEVLNLALTDISGEVPLGVRQIPASGVLPVFGTGVLATVYFRNEPFTQPRNVSCSPKGPTNAVDDLAIISQGATTATLRWTEHNCGDYDNNGLVSISDLTPLGANFGQTVATSPDPVWAAMVDGDGNGQINIADMTPIGSNWSSQVSGYILYTDAASGTPYGSGLTVERAPFFVSNKTPVVYSFTATVPSGETLYFSVKPAASDDVVNPGPPSNQAQVVIDPGPPAPPSNLTATSDSTIGVGNVKLDWTASTSTDLAAYEVWHKKSTEDDSAWVKVYDVPVLNPTYTDTGLSIESWDFKVCARDFTDQVSTFSDVASATPYTVPPPDPPIDVTAVPHPTVGSAIKVTWNPPANDSAMGFEVYQKGPQDADFVLIDTKVTKFDTETVASGLIPLETYEYYVISTAGPMKSAESQHAFSQCSAMANIQILDLTTDKTTHFTGGGEPASNITVTTDIAPDSVDWTATQGSCTGSGTTVQWSPPGGATPGVVTISCTVHKGSNTDNATLMLYLTSETIKTAYGTNGAYVDFSNLPSNEVPNAPYRPFSYYVTGENVILVNAWGLW